MTGLDAGSAAGTGSSSLSFLNLPQETQNQIIGHCSQGDLICLALVSKHFRQLAAAQLYRNFHIIFPDEDDPNYDSPIDGLACGLDTFVTSDYNYARHLKDLSLDTLSTGDKAEGAYKPYLYSLSCGKFMNTLLYLTLRKAKSLESFRWNIRVELSRPVYRALHDIASLRHFHIRMQAGPSLYEAPPPLPYTEPTFHGSLSVGHYISSAAPVAPPSNGWADLASLPPPPPPNWTPLQLSYPYPAPATSIPPLPKPPARNASPKKNAGANPPPTLSGFSKLKSLSVLDVDNLDVVPEIRACLRDSASTLTKLELSFSESLALRARKPPPENDPDDSDPEDEFQVVPIPPPVGSGAGFLDDVTGPAKAFRAQEERKTQETVLGRIFDVEQPAAKKTTRRCVEKKREPREEPPAAPGDAFLQSVMKVSEQLNAKVYGKSSLSSQETLDVIAYAAKKYVAATEAEAKAHDEPKTEGAGGSSASGVVKPDDKEKETNPSALDTPPSSLGSGLFDPKSKGQGAEKDVSPDDINIEEPEEQLAMEPQDKDSHNGSASVTRASTPKIPSVSNPFTPPPFASRFERVIWLAEKVWHIKEADFYKPGVPYNDDQLAQIANSCKLLLGTKPPADLSQVTGDKDNIPAGKERTSGPQDTGRVDVGGSNAVGQAVGNGGEEDEEVQNRRITEYVRSTRGLALKSLSIYLIPVRASVLSRAINLHTLTQLTLLNVGPQTPVWSLLTRENRMSPLPLRSIYTDNVSPAFLACVSQLEELHELFMIERAPKYKPESFAPKTTTTIDQIRRQALKKHMHTLKRLMIKNGSDGTWDADVKTILLICKRGIVLEELSVCMGIRAVHAFMQHLSGLTSLRALSIPQLRNEDTCVWVMRETRRFLVDNLSHHPELKLEYISFDDERIVEQILRQEVTPKKSKKAKGKEKAAPGATGTNVFPVLPTEGWNSDSETDEDEFFDINHGLKLEMIEGLNYYEVGGVRIFEKEIIDARL